MGLRHREHDVEGVQFHPESVLTREGKRLVGNWLEVAGAQRATIRARSRSMSARLLARPSPACSRASPLGADDVRAAFEAILGGEWTPVQIGAFAVALRMRGETRGDDRSARPRRCAAAMTVGRARPAARRRHVRHRAATARTR